MRGIARICLSISAISLCIWPFSASAQAVDPRTDPANLLSVSASWNSVPLANSATSSVPLDQDGLLSWNISYDASNTDLVDYLPSLRNALYTLQLYKGVIGSSLLLHTEMIPNASATSSGSFSFAFPGAGKYLLTYTATYATGTYPIGEGPESCRGDFCLLPQFSLSDFTQFMLDGQLQDPQTYGHPIPALFGIDEFTIASPPGPKTSNVLFLPGTMESRLYMKDANGNEKLLWEPIRNADIPQLSMTVEGISRNEIYTRDIIDSLYSFDPLLSKTVRGLAKNSADMYAPFIHFMDSLVQNGTIRSWQAFPYDWRSDAKDIVQNGTLIGSPTVATHRIFLEDIVAALASSSPTGQVSIIAHSNGGLLAKALAVALQKDGKINLLDKIIMVGTPQFGTPSTIGNLLHADGQTRMLGLVTNGTTIRTAAKNMPGAYALLPDSAYFSYVASPVATFDNSITLVPYQGAYGAEIQDYESLSKYLTDAAGLRATVTNSDLRTPAVLSSGMLRAAQNSHSSIDAWVPPPSLALTSITGMGQLTPSGYTYSSGPIQRSCHIESLNVSCATLPWITHQPILTTQGDDTVVSISSAGNPGKQIYFDSQSYAKDSGENITHQSLPNAVPIQNELVSLLTNTERPRAYISTTTPAYPVVPDIVISAHSPVTIVATDSAGNQSGLVPIPGTDMHVIKEDIPGSSVQVVDDEKYIYLPDANSTYSFSLQGEDTGATAIQLGRLNARGTIDTVETVAAIPTTNRMTASFTVSHAEMSPISVDTNGDGTIDVVASSNMPASYSRTSENAMQSNTSSSSYVSGQSTISTYNTGTSTSRNILILRLKLTLLQLQLELMKLLQQLHLTHA